MKVVFGKRAAAAAAPTPDADSVTRAIPKSLWEDSAVGDFLRSLGASPDGPTNVVQSQSDVQAQADHLAELSKQFVARWNARLPREVAPWAMVPYACWQGEHADFLLADLEMFPMDAWNTLLLPIDEEGALALELPRHPGVADAQHLANANSLVGELREEFARHHREASDNAASGDFSAIEGFDEVREHTRDNLKGMARGLAARIVGEAAVLRSRQMFFAEK